MESGLFLALEARSYGAARTWLSELEAFAERAERVGDNKFVIQMLYACAIRCRDILGMNGDGGSLSRIEIAEELASALDLGETADRFAGVVSQLIERAEDRDDASAALRARRFIDRHFGSGIKPRDVARAVGYSQSYLCREFKNGVGQTLGGYLRRVRIEEATRLLSTTTLLAKEIGFDVGYQNYRSFARDFARENGTSPSSYRGNVS